MNTEENNKRNKQMNKIYGLHYQKNTPFFCENSEGFQNPWNKLNGPIECLKSYFFGLLVVWNTQLNRFHDLLSKSWFLYVPHTVESCFYGVNRPWSIFTPTSLPTNGGTNTYREQMTCSIEERLWRKELGWILF